MSDPSSTRWRTATIALLIALSLARLATIALGPLSLSPDEAHYWEWSRRLDASYYSKGPLVAWLIAASTRVLGSTELGVRAPAVLLALGAALVGVRLSLDAFGSARAAFLGALVASATPLFAAGSMLMTIDAPWAFCWLVATWCLWRASDPRRGDAAAWWLACGLAVGIGTLAKYTMVLFLPCAAMALAASGRSLPSLGQACGALALAAAAALPMVEWNAAHGWVSLRHVLGQAGLASEARPVSALRSALDFAGSQIAIVSPGILIALGAWIVRVTTKRTLDASRAAERFLLGSSLPMIAFFAAWSFHSKVQPNWAAAAWIAPLLGLAAHWDVRLREADTARFRAAIALALAPGFVLVLLVHDPDLPRRLGAPLPAQLDPSRRLRGWRDLGREVGALASTAAAPRALAAASYQTTGELAFYVQGQPSVFDLDLGGRRMNQHDVWGDAATLSGDLLFVADDASPDPPAELTRRCARVEPRAVVTRIAPSASDAGATASVFACDGYRAPVASAAPTRY